MEQSHLSSQIGKRIKLYRKQQKMTLEDLAACINRSKATVSKYECGAIVLGCGDALRNCGSTASSAELPDGDSGRTGR